MRLAGSGEWCGASTGESPHLSVTYRYLSSLFRYIPLPIVAVTVWRACRNVAASLRYIPLPIVAVTVWRACRSVAASFRSIATKKRQKERRVLLVSCSTCRASSRRVQPSLVGIAHQAAIIEHQSGFIIGRLTGANSHHPTSQATLTVTRTHPPYSNSYTRSTPTYTI